jgi:hypothetical protein
MEDEVVVEPAELTAPEQGVTATPEPEVVTPESNDAPKTFTQEELDAAIGKRLAIQQRKWEREQAARQQASVPHVAPSDVVPEQFDTTEAYVEALATAKAQELIRHREMTSQQAEINAAYSDREEEAREKYDDFEQVAYNPRIPITDSMAETIRASEIGPDVIYFLGSNPKEAERISKLTPLAQAKEIGKLEVKLTASPPVKKTSSAPAPITPVTARGSGSPAYDTTDPRSTKTMTTSQWIEAERQRQVKAWEASKLR